MVKRILTCLLCIISFNVVFAQDIESSGSLDHLLSIVVGPNPASSQVTLSTNSQVDFQVNMTDVLGNLLLSESFYDGFGKLDVSKYKNGIYFITVEAEGVKPVTRKLVIRH